MFVQPFTYAYNTQVHRSKNTIPRSLVLNRQPPGPSLLTKSTNLPDSGSDPTSPQAMRAKVQLRIAALRFKTDPHTRKSQKK